MDVPSKISTVENRTSPVGAGRPVERARNATTGARSQGDSDAVQITGAARSLAELEQAVRNMPAVDEARVEAVRSAIAQGHYQIVPERIADQLLQLEQALAPLGEK